MSAGPRHQLIGDVSTADHDDLRIRECASFMVGITVKADRLNWVYNGLRFRDSEEAAQYAHALILRWGDAVDYQIAESDDLPNCTYPVPSDRYPVSRQQEKGGVILDAEGHRTAPQDQ